MTYNLTLMENATSYAAYPLAVNTMSGNQFGIWIPVAVFLITLFIFRNSEFEKSLIASFVFTALIGSLEFFFGILPLKYLTSFVIIGLVISIIMLMFSKD